MCTEKKTTLLIYILFYIKLGSRVRSQKKKVGSWVKKKIDWDEFDFTNWDTLKREKNLNKWPWFMLEVKLFILYKFVYKT